MVFSIIMHLRISPSTLHGSIAVPPSKSQTMRALLFALRARGTSEILSPLPSPDTQAMVRAIAQLGARIECKPDRLYVTGVEALSPTVEAIDAKNSGQVLRFVGAMAGHLTRMTVFTGDYSVQNNRPVGPLLSALKQLGAEAHALKKSDFAPFVIKGPITPGCASFCGRDSQPVSAMLMATAFLEGTTELRISHPGELPWVELTLDWIKKLGGCVINDEHTRYTVKGGLRYESFSYAVPGDFSSAAYPIGAALVTKSAITVSNLDMSDPQGDKALLYALERMGARLDIDEVSKTIHVRPHHGLVGITVDVNPFIDALPLLAAVACFAQTPTRIVGAANARHKESDRIDAMTKELRTMGAQIEEHPDGLVIFPSQLVGACVQSHQDHRVAMALAVAAMGARGASRIDEAQWIEKSYPSFVRDFTKLGVQVQIS